MSSRGKNAADEKMLEQMLLSLLEKRPQLSAAPPGEPSEPEPPVQASQALHAEDNLLDADAMAAIRETLTAFQQG